MRILFNAGDRLSLSFIALLAAITVFSIPLLYAWAKLLGTYIVLSAALVIVAWYRRRSNSSRSAFYLNLVVTVTMILVLFNSLGDLIPGIRSRTFDPLLIKIDFALFGAHPTVWMERLINPLLTAMLQFAYISYYFMPISLGVTLIAKGKRPEFEKALFGIVLCFYLSYIGYLLVPAVGPRFTLKELQTTSLQASPFIAAIQETLNGLEHNKTDAFPSGHTAIALVSLYYAWKLREHVLFRVLLPFVLALIFSTVYLRYHYVIDVIAGIALAGVTVSLAPNLSRWLSRATGNSGNERHRAS